jgi:hypothetical protein
MGKGREVWSVERERKKEKKRDSKGGLRISLPPSLSQSLSLSLSQSLSLLSIDRKVLTFCKACMIKNKAINSA